MNGWATELAFWKESTLMGTQTGTAYRPPGVVDVAFRPMPAGRYEAADILRACNADVVTQQAWQITIRREPKVSGFESFWIDSITDGVATVTTGGGYTITSKQRVDNVSVPTFGLEFVLEDGSQRRFIGCAVTRLEWTLEAGRILAEEVEFTALRSAEFTGSIRAATALNLPVLGSYDCAHYFKPGSAWTGGDFTNDKARTISAQLIWERTVDACQFNADGLATKLAVSTGWDFVGKTRVQVPTYWQALHETTQSLARWRVGNGDFHQITATVEAKLSGHSVLATGQVDHLIDFRAIRPIGSRALFTWENYQRI